MAAVSKVGDANTGGGTINSAAQSGFNVNGVKASVNGSTVGPHAPGGPHNSAVTANGNSNFLIDGKPTNTVGNADSCATHTRAGGDSSFNIG
jgi:uncharacterized Zn-binding protein involved in type VI secretion